jgi:hypothetical protein
MASDSHVAPIGSPEPPVTIGPPVAASSTIVRRVCTIAHGTPPWTVSLIVHALALTVLGLLYVEEQLHIETTLLAYHALPLEAEEMVTYETVKMQATEALHVDSLTSGSMSEEAKNASAFPSVVAGDLDPDAVINVSTVDGMPSGDALLYAVPIHRQKPAQAQRGQRAGAQRELQMAEAAERGEAAFGEQLMDQIVYRFILWDIGRLPGQEGADARQAFDNLTIDALPALVRGINASAYLQASCPVIVLSSKIESLVTQSKDPEKYRYALENIGQGVDPNAPYASYLARLRQRLAQQAGGGGGAGGDVASGDVGRQRRADYVRHLTRARVAQLRKSLESDDAELRWAAAQVIAARGILIPEHVIPLLDDEDAQVRSQAHVTLVRLARGADLGPEDDATEEELAEAMDAWRDWWRQNRNRPGVSEFRPEELESEGGAAAAKQLKRADELRDAGAFSSALRLYGEIVEKFPDSAAAKTAADRIKRLE